VIESVLRQEGETVRHELEIDAIPKVKGRPLSCEIQQACGDIDREIGRFEYVAVLGAAGVAGLEHERA